MKFGQLLNSIWKSLRFRLVATIVLFAFPPLVILAWFAYQDNVERHRRQASETLAIGHQKAVGNIEKFYLQKEQKLGLIVRQPMSRQVFQDLSQAFYSLQDSLEGRYAKDDAAFKQFYRKQWLTNFKNQREANQINWQDFLPERKVTAYLQDRFILQNPKPLDKKADFRLNTPKNAYEQFHQIYQNSFHDWAYFTEATDIYLVDVRRNDVVYTYAKKMDYATNLINGPFANTDLAAVVDRLQAGSNVEVFTSDIFYSELAFNQPRFLMAKPIYGQGELIGVMVFEFEATEIQEQLNEVIALSNVDFHNHFMVAEDGSFRSESSEMLFHRGDYLQNLGKYVPEIDRQKNIQSFQSDVLHRQLPQEKAAVLLNPKAAGEDLTIEGEVGAGNAYRSTPVKVGSRTYYIVSKLDLESLLAENTGFFKGLLLFLLVSGGIVLLVVIVLSGQIVRPFLNMHKAVLSLGAGELPKEVKKSDDTVIQEMGQSIMRFTNYISHVATFVTHLGKGRFDTELKPLSQSKNPLDKALLQMRDNLKDISEEEAKRKWTSDGLTYFAGILQKESQDITQLSDDVLAALVRHIEAKIGAIYLISTEDDDVLEQVALYAFDRKKYEEKSFLIGEGLVGQAAKEQQSIYLQDVPKDYIRIKSGLGDAAPAFVLIVPLKLNEQVFGAMEIASMRPLQQYEIDFCEKLAESIAITFSSVRNNERTRYLLKESQQKTEQLQAQEEEMRQHLEEMEATQEEMKRSELELYAQQSALNNAALVCQCDPNGFITYVNDAFLERSGYSEADLSGKHLNEFEHGDSSEETDFYEALLQKLNAGEVWKGEQQQRTQSGESYWLKWFVTPAFNDEGTFVKFIMVGFDITDKKEQDLQITRQLEELQENEEQLRQSMEEMQATQQEMKHYQLELTAQQAALNNAAMVVELDLEAKVTYVNDAFCQTTGFEVETLLGTVQTELLADVDAAVFEEMWKTLVEGKLWKGELKHKSKSGSAFLCMTVITPILDDYGNPDKFISVAINVEELLQKNEVGKVQEAEMQAQMAMVEESLQAEIAAREVENKQLSLRLDTYQEMMPGFVLNSAGRFEWANAAFYALSAYTPDELNGASLDALKHDQTEDATFVAMKAAVENQTTWKGTLVTKSKTGKYFRLKAKLSPRKNEQDEAQEFIFVGQDITAVQSQHDRKEELIEELRKDYLSLHKAYENIEKRLKMANFSNEVANEAAMFLTLDEKGIIKNVNRSFCEWTGFDQKEVLDKSMVTHLYERPDEELIDILGKLRNGEQIDGDTRLLRKNQPSLKVQELMHPKIGEDGNLKSIVIMLFPLEKVASSAVKFDDAIAEKRALAFMTSENRAQK